jgi:hypothetical protein
MPQIRLSTIAFYRRHLPAELQLAACGIPLSSPIAHGLCTLYGSTGQREAFLWAKLYAASKGLQFTVVDLVVTTERDMKPGVVHPADLPDRDFISLERLSRASSDYLAGVVLTEATIKRHRPVVDRIDKMVLSEPSLIDALVESSVVRHVKLFAASTRTLLGDAPLTLGVIPYRHWNAITAAHCRLDPEVNILCDRPGVPHSE